jgi:hypothetical protein
LRPTNDSYRVDETYVKIKGKWYYLYRAVDSSRVNPGLGFFSFNTARRTISRYETVNIIRKGQIEGVGKGDIRGQVRFVSSLFCIAV